MSREGVTGAVGTDESSDEGREESSDEGGRELSGGSSDETDDGVDDERERSGDGTEEEGTDDDRLISCANAGAVSSKNPKTSRRAMLCNSSSLLPPQRDLIAATIL